MLLIINLPAFIKLQGHTPIPLPNPSQMRRLPYCLTFDFGQVKYCNIITGFPAG